MRRVFGRLRSSSILHPLLFASFPVVFLWARNTTQAVAPRTVLGVLFVCWAAAAIVYAGVRAFAHDRFRAGLVASAVVVWVTAFGHVERVLGVASESMNERWLVLGWTATFAGAVVVALRTTHGPGATRVLNLVSSVLVGMNLVPIVTTATAAASAPVVPVRTQFGMLDPAAAGPPRDVYYVIFDRYANERTLQHLYGFDNSPFLSSLEARGFRVIHDARANYPQTAHSLSSSLNLTYLDALTRQVGAESDDFEPLYSMLQDPAIGRAFHQMGYRVDWVGSGWDPTMSSPAADRNYSYQWISEFSNVFVENTILPVAADLVGADLQALPRIEQEHYRRILYEVRALEEISRDPARTFTFAHLEMPHLPYVFDAQGDYRWDPVASSEPEGIERLYLDQLIYTNVLIERIVDALLAGDDDPIVIIQSDEGPYPPADEAVQRPFSLTSTTDEDLQRKMRILNAYYLPGLADTGLYGSITPVNTFRLVLDDYFGAHLPLLADRSYAWQDYQHLYRFTDVTDRLTS